VDVGWIPESNLRAFVELVARVAGDATFDDLDVDAITWGVRDTDSDHDRWFSYPFRGQYSLRLALAQPPGSAILDVRVVGVPPDDTSQAGEADDEPPAALLPLLHLLVEICQEYHVTPRH
jgi:hypothetical protein